MLGNLITRLGFAALRIGVSLPDWPPVQRFLQLASLRDLIERLRVNCIIDVGANKGQFARKMRRLGYAGLILSFEPIIDDFEVLSRLAQTDPRWKTFNLALGSENSTRDFNIIKSDGDETVLSSFLSPERGTQIPSFLIPAKSVRVERTERVEIKRLDSILDGLLEGIDQPRIFLKIDTQGYDVEVVKGAEGSLPRIVGLQSEISVTPLYTGMPHYTKALDYYESLGFSLLDLFIVHRTSRRSILEYDCVMARLDELDA